MSATLPAPPRTRTAGAPRRTRLAAVSEVREGQTRKFRFQRDGRQHDGFLVRYHGRIVAYENRCRHLPLSLDLDDNRFFSADGDHLVCQAHGALYDPATGYCVRGPCGGETLTALAVEVIDGVVWLVL
ncbi:MAG: Rieske 2Fe-2S domain-containing protein [Verrucomicrobia bacterium]|nr:Rieske 2Fe-2S domain-containing protein [Verrucomicrobiota bacterium]